MTKSAAPDCILIFSGKSEIRLLKYLRPGFRHCLTIIKTREHLTMIDAMSHKTSVEVLENNDLVTALYYLQDRGYTVLRLKTRNPPRHLPPLRPYTCVETAKRLVGVLDGTIFLPWQMYRWIRAGKK